MKNFVRHAMETAKMIVFEKGHLIYALNRPGYRKSLQELRKKEKKQKIRVGFLIQVPNNWAVLEPVYEAARQMEDVEPVILLMPELTYFCYVRLVKVDWEKTYAFGHEKYGDQCVETWNPKTETWIDPATLDLDYVFLPRPYETYLPKAYKASGLRKVTRVCYVPYSSPLLDDYRLLYNMHFVRNVRLIFCEKQHSLEYVSRMLRPTLASGEQKAFCTGFPKFDMNQRGEGLESPLWPRPHGEVQQRIIWTPRWNMDPWLGGSSFMKYRENMLQYAREHSDVDLIFRPHPLAKDSLVGDGYLTEQEWDAYLQEYRDGTNTNVDLTSTYYDLMWSSEVLITDVSSMIMDYLLTGHPIIYCATQVMGKMSDDPSLAIRDLLPGLYIAHDFSQIEAVLNQLRRGEDPKYEIRQQLVRRMRRDGHIGKNIMELLVKDYRED